MCQILNLFNSHRKFFIFWVDVHFLDTALRDEHDLALGKIEFLNTVIVELQHKNEEQKKNIQLLTDTADQMNGGAENDNFESRWIFPLTKVCAWKYFFCMMQTSTRYDFVICFKYFSSMHFIITRKSFLSTTWMVMLSVRSNLSSVLHGR